VAVVVGMATITIDNRTREAVQMPKLSAENKKFEFTGETIEVKGTDGKVHTLYRIRAKKDFIRVLGGITMEVHAGDLGGFIEKESNLDFSEDSDAWVGDSAQVYENARVSRRAVVRGHAIVCGNAVISDNAYVNDHARVLGDAKVLGSAEVSWYAEVHDRAIVSENARLLDHALAAEDSRIHGNTWAFGYSNFHDYAEVYGDVKAYENAGFGDHSKVFGHIEVLGHVLIRGDVQITSETYMRITEGKFYFGIINSNEKLKIYLEGKEKIDRELLHARTQEMQKLGRF